MNQLTKQALIAFVVSVLVCVAEKVTGISHAVASAVGG